MHLVAVCAQVVVACSVLFVWVAHFPNVVAEFREYGIPDSVRTVVGAVKIALSTLLIVAIWYPALAMVPALLMAGLMVCAIVAHVRVHHGWQKSAPAGVLLVLSLFVAYAYAVPVRL